MEIEMNSSNNINPKPCNYGCNTRIYWNATENTFFEVFSGKRHSCPNRSTKKKSVITQTTTNNKPKYYNANSRSFTTSVPKPKMSNSLELLQGPIVDIQRKYEILSDIVSEANGKVHGSQSYIVTAANNNSTIISLIIYYEVPAEGKRDEVKQRFEQFDRNTVFMHNR